MKSFEEIYSVVYSKAKDEIDVIISKNRRNKLIAALVSIVTAVIIFTLFNDSIYVSQFMLYFFVVGIGFLLFFTISSVMNAGYNKKYKELIIRPMINEMGSKLNYEPSHGEPESIYRNSGLNYSRYDRYNSEDQVYGKLEDGSYIEFSEISTIKEETYKDSEGHTQTREVVTFRGMFGKLELKTEVFDHIHIEPNSTFSTFSKSRVEMDSAEFEKYFDVFSNDRIKAMQIFTSDIIEKYSNYMNATKTKIELSISNRDIYFRVACGSMFEAPMWNNPLDEKVLRRNYGLVYYPIELLQATAESVKRVYDNY